MTTSPPPCGANIRKENTEVGGPGVRAVEMGEKRRLMGKQDPNLPRGTIMVEGAPKLVNEGVECRVGRKSASQCPGSGSGGE